MATRTTIGTVGLGDSFGLIRVGWPRGERRAAARRRRQHLRAVRSRRGVLRPHQRGLRHRPAIDVPSRRLQHAAEGGTRSSHLGDEYLLRDRRDRPREPLVESVAALVSQEIGPLRLYAGAERLFRASRPGSPSKSFQAGVELRSARSGAGQLVSGVDVKTTERHDWSPAISGRLGFEVARHGTGGHPARRIGLLLEVYHGPVALRAVLPRRHRVHRHRPALRAVIAEARASTTAVRRLLHAVAHRLAEIDPDADPRERILDGGLRELVNERVRGTASSHRLPVGSDRLQPPSIAWPEQMIGLGYVVMVLVTLVAGLAGTRLLAQVGAVVGGGGVSATRWPPRWAEWCSHPGSRERNAAHRARFDNRQAGTIIGGSQSALSHGRVEHECFRPSGSICTSSRASRRLFG